VLARVQLDLDRDGIGALRPRVFLREAEVLGEEGRQIATDDLRRRPPERLGFDERATGPGLGAGEAGREAG